MWLIMEIQLDKDYYIQSDNYCFKLGRYKTVKGNKIFYPEGYFTTFVGAMQGYISENMLRSKASDFKQLKLELEEIKSRLKDIYTFIEENDIEVKREYKRIDDEEIKD